MFEPNVERVLSKIGENDVVLDVGGWARCFNRANYVLDSGPYETHGQWYRDKRGLLAQGGDKEYFTKDTWFARDICDHTPWPLADKSIDYCVCSHTLEDIRDPLWACSEMIRVAKAGYIEIPSRMSEQCRTPSAGFVGVPHHRWMIEIEENHIKFFQKYHSIHGDYRSSFPASFLLALPPEKQVTYLFWEDSFTYEEVTIHGPDAIREELNQFVRRHYQYGVTRSMFESGKKRLNWVFSQPARVRRRLGRLLNRNDH
jgi:hypothetical protein